MTSLFFFSFSKVKELKFSTRFRIRFYQNTTPSFFINKIKRYKTANSVANEKNSKQMHEFWGWHVGFKRDFPMRNLTLKLTFFIQLKKIIAKRKQFSQSVKF